MTDILVAYYSRHGSVREMARLVARGVSAVDDCNATVRAIAPVSPEHDAVAPAVPDRGDPYVSIADLEACDGLVLGSPVYFGNMAAPVKYFLDTTSALWANGTLVGKPAAVFGGSSSMHGGQESGLLTMMLPLLHHGMYLVGIPYTEKTLNTTRTGGTPYGASHLAGSSSNLPISDDEKVLCISLGKRVARLAKTLAGA